MGAEYWGAGTDVIHQRRGQTARKRLFHCARYDRSGYLYDGSGGYQGDILLKKWDSETSRGDDSEAGGDRCEVEEFDDTIRVIASGDSGEHM